MVRSCSLALAVIGLLAGVAGAADFAVLTPATYDDFAPQGKEVDAIYGDYVLRNEHVVAVIAQPLASRNANMTVRGVGGSLIDFTERKAQNDQLSAYYPAAGRYPLTDPKKVRLIADGMAVAVLPSAPLAAREISLEIDADPVEGRPQLTLRYSLTSDSRDLVIETIFKNNTDKPVSDDLSDSIRADRTFSFGFDPATRCFWASDEWFLQAYGVVVADGYEIKGTGQRGTLLALIKDGSSKLTLAPGQSHTISRRVFPATSLLGVRGLAGQVAGQTVTPAWIRVADTAPIAQARVVVTKAGELYASGRTDGEGKIEFLLPAGPFVVAATSIDGRSAKAEITGGQTIAQTINLPAASFVKATITAADGRPIPAKVSFTGTGGTADPDWGPDSGEIAVKNVYYTHTGSFQQPIAPGKYDVIVSFGPEHDAVFTSIEVPAGGIAELKATLKRSVDTRGWISADFHSHASPSGDNTASQFGRVLNLLCEHIEFAPCTEHNRIDTYVPHLKRLGTQHLMATCTGMELTGGLLPVNHQNAFPLVHKPRTQDGGGPAIDTNPIVQIERLALWDNKSEKLVQMNHPNLPQILGDRDLDGKPDDGFERMLGSVDVIEIHPPQGIFAPPEKQADGKPERNPAFHWMQMLNLGYKQPGVINTDSHYNYHESGFYRNFIQCSTDDPAKIDTMEIVRSSEAGHVVVSTGPFLSVTATGVSVTGRVASGTCGEVLDASDGAQLHVKVQCPNWFDINRVQLFLNGRPSEKLNFTRRLAPDRFSDGVVRFEATLSLPLDKDTHVIVATIGEGLSLGPVMGPQWGKLPPVAVANPIFFDVDGGGFKPNGDLLDLPLSLAPERAAAAPAR